MTLVMHRLCFQKCLGKAEDWSDTPELGTAEPCRGAFTGCRLCRRPPELENLMIGWTDGWMHMGSHQLHEAHLAVCRLITHSAYIQAWHQTPNDMHARLM